MWETVFDESMLFSGKDLIVYCPNEYLANELMEVFERNDIRWGGGESAVGHTSWGVYKEETCYWVEGSELTYGYRNYVSECPDEYSNHIKCTFYGEIESTFEPADDSELLAFLGL